MTRAGKYGNGRCFCQYTRVTISITIICDFILSASWDWLGVNMQCVHNLMDDNILNCALACALLQRKTSKKKILWRPLLPPTNVCKTCETNTHILQHIHTHSTHKLSHSHPCTSTEISTHTHTHRNVWYKARWNEFSAGFWVIKALLGSQSVQHIFDWIKRKLTRSVSKWPQ